MRRLKTIEAKAVSAVIVVVLVSMASLGTSLSVKQTGSAFAARPV